MADAVPSTVVELIDWFEDSFQCFLGAPRAYFEIRLGPDFFYPGTDNAVFRGVYQTHAIKTKDETNAERNLVHAMYQDFVPFAGAGHALFWRLPEKIALKCDLVQEYGLLVATAEVVEDYITRAPSSGIVVDEIGNWHADGGKSKEWVLRTRLCIPAASWIVAPPMITKKTEALRTPSI